MGERMEWQKVLVGMGSLSSPLHSSPVLSIRGREMPSISKSPASIRLSRMETQSTNGMTSPATQRTITPVPTVATAGLIWGTSTAATCFVRRFNIGEIVDAPRWRLRKSMTAHQGQTGPTDRYIIRFVQPGPWWTRRGGERLRHMKDRLLRRQEVEAGHGTGSFDVIPEDAGGDIPAVCESHLQVSQVEGE